MSMVDLISFQWCTIILEEPHCSSEISIKRHCDWLSLNISKNSTKDHHGLLNSAVKDTQSHAYQPRTGILKHYNCYIVSNSEMLISIEKSVKN